MSRIYEIFMIVLCILYVRSGNYANISPAAPEFQVPLVSRARYKRARCEGNLTRVHGAPVQIPR